MATTGKKTKTTTKSGKKTVTRANKRTLAKNKSEVCVIEEVLPVTQVYLYEDDCCCVL